MGLNVFKDYNCYTTRYKLIHPWVIITNGCRNIKAAWQRAIRGYADRDTWSLDNWLLQVLPAALNHLAKHSHGWPANDEFPTFEDWQKYLFKIADDLKSCQDPDGDNKNEYYDEYMKQFENWDAKWERDSNGNLVHKAERTEIDEKYFTRLKELANGQQMLLEDAFTRLAKHLYGMWD